MCPDISKIKENHSVNTISIKCATRKVAMVFKKYSFNISINILALWGVLTGYFIQLDCESIDLLMWWVQGPVIFIFGRQVTHRSEWCNPAP